MGSSRKKFQKRFSAPQLVQINNGKSASVEQLSDSSKGA
jgi:hypothetical protein